MVSYGIPYPAVGGSLWERLTDVFDSASTFDSRKDPNFPHAISPDDSIGTKMGWYKNWAQQLISDPTAMNARPGDVYVFWDNAPQLTGDMASAQQLLDSLRRQHPNGENMVTLNQRLSELDDLWNDPEIPTSFKAQVTSALSARFAQGAGEQIVYVTSSDPWGKSTGARPNSVSIGFHHELDNLFRNQNVQDVVSVLRGSTPENMQIKDVPKEQWIPSRMNYQTIGRWKDMRDLSKELIGNLENLSPDRLSAIARNLDMAYHNTAATAIGLYKNPDPDAKWTFSRLAQHAADEGHIAGVLDSLRKQLDGQVPENVIRRITRDFENERINSVNSRDLQRFTPKPYEPDFARIGDIETRLAQGDIPGRAAGIDTPQQFKLGLSDMGMSGASAGLATYNLVQGYRNEDYLQAGAGLFDLGVEGLQVASSAGWIRNTGMTRILPGLGVVTGYTETAGHMFEGDWSKAGTSAMANTGEVAFGTGGIFAATMYSGTAISGGTFLPALAAGYFGASGGREIMIGGQHILADLGLIDYSNIPQHSALGDWALRSGWSDVISDRMVGQPVNFDPLLNGSFAEIGRDSGYNDFFAGVFNGELDTRPLESGSFADLGRNSGATNFFADIHNRIFHGGRGTDEALARGEAETARVMAAFHEARENALRGVEPAFNDPEMAEKLLQALPDRDALPPDASRQMYRMAKLAEEYRTAETPEERTQALERFENRLGKIGRSGNFDEALVEETNGYLQSNDTIEEGARVRAAFHEARENALRGVEPAFNDPEMAEKLLQALPDRDALPPDASRQMYRMAKLAENYREAQTPEERAEVLERFESRLSKMAQSGNFNEDIAQETNGYLQQSVLAESAGENTPAYHLTLFSAEQNFEVFRERMGFTDSLSIPADHENYREMMDVLAKDVWDRLPADGNVPEDAPQAVKDLAMHKARFEETGNLAYKNGFYNDLFSELAHGEDPAALGQYIIDKFPAPADALEPVQNAAEMSTQDPDTIASGDHLTLETSGENPEMAAHSQPMGQIITFRTQEEIFKDNASQKSDLYAALSPEEFDGAINALFEDMLGWIPTSDEIPGGADSVEHIGLQSLIEQKTHIEALKASGHDELAEERLAELREDFFREANEGPENLAAIENNLRKLEERMQPEPGMVPTPGAEPVSAMNASIPAPGM